MRLTKSIVFMTALVAAGFGQAIPEGEPAPSFFLRTDSGSSFFLSKVVGPKAKPEARRPVVLSFFATWCIPCKKEIPQLHILQEKYPDVGIYLVDVNEGPELVNEYIAQYEVKLPVLMDRYGTTAKKYGVVDENGVGNLPTLFIIDTSGKIVMSHVGYKEGDEKTYDNILANLTKTAE